MSTVKAMSSAGRLIDVPRTGPAKGTDASVAIRSLFDSHGSKLYMLATRLCGNAEDARDMVQDVFLQAFRKWHTFKGQSSASTWLYAIAARACRSRRRRKGGTDRRMPAVSQLLPWTERTNLDLSAEAFLDSRGARDVSTGQPLQREATPQQRAIERESALAVHAAILTLPERFRVPLVLKEMLELSVEDVASALGLKPDTVKTRVHRARLHLRKAILSRRVLRTHTAKEPIYEKRVCLDLLKAKLEAMDRGRGFPLAQSVVCERCRDVFAELDLAQNACASLAEGQMPASVRGAIERAIRRAADERSGVDD